MAVVSVLEQFTDRSVMGDYKATREYVRAFKVVTSSLVDDAITVSAAAGIPRIFDRYIGSDLEIDPLGALCTKVEPRCVGEFEWMVRCSYSNRCDWPDLGNPNPLARPSEVEWGFESRSRVLAYDLAGKAVTNSAGEKFDPPVEVADDVLTVTITRNESSYDPNRSQLYKNAVNSDTFYGAQPGLAQIKPIKGVRSYENNVFYWKVTYIIRFRGQGDPPWQPAELDQGFYHLVGGKKVINTDELYGGPLQSPALLDGKGGLWSHANATLTVPIGAHDTQIVINMTAAQSLPTTYPYTITVDGEQMTVTGNVGGATTVLTVVRGANNTTAAAHLGASVVQLNPVFLTFQAYPSLPFAALNIP